MAEESRSMLATEKKRSKGGRGNDPKVSAALESEHTRSNGTDGREQTKDLKVPQNCIKHVIGKDVGKLQELEQKYRVKITNTNGKSCKVTITGQTENVDQAYSELEVCLKEAKALSRSGANHKTPAEEEPKESSKTAACDKRERSRTGLSKVTRQITVTRRSARYVIGVGGGNIRRMMHFLHVKIVTINTPANQQASNDGCTFEVSGNETDVCKALENIQNMAQIIENDKIRFPENFGNIVTIPGRLAGHIIGKNREKLNQLAEKFNVRILMSTETKGEFLVLGNVEEDIERAEAEITRIAKLLSQQHPQH